MPEKTEATTVWIRNSDGHKAAIAPSDVDYWKVQGWVRVAGLRDTDKVWLQNDVTGGKQLFDRSVVEQWGALGWKPTAPPLPVDLTKDSNLTDPDEEVVEDDLVEEVVPAKKSASAAKKES